jgi:hypothetical protein
MRTVKDSFGHVWTLKLDCKRALTIRTTCGVDLLSFKNVDKLFAALLEDFSVALKVAWEMLEPTDKRPEFDEFSTFFQGESLETLIEAVFQECIDFFPFEKMRKALRAGWERSRNELEKAFQTIEEKFLNEPLPTTSG